MSDHIASAAEVIEHVLSRHGEHGTYLDAARALDAAGLLAVPARDAAVRAEALAEFTVETDAGNPYYPLRRLVGPWEPEP